MMEFPIARFDRDGIRNTLREVLGTRLPFGCATTDVEISFDVEASKLQVSPEVASC